jgi:hypothetical protein
MGTVYAGVPANIATLAPSSASATLPVDGDADNAATFTVGSQHLVDYIAAIGYHIGSMAVSNFVVRATATTRSLNGIAFNANASSPLYVVVGDAAAAPATILTSIDGVTWTAATAVGTSTSLNAVTFGGGLWVAVGSGASGQNIQTSTTGTTGWTLRTSGLGGALTCVAYNGTNLYVAAGSVSGALNYATSPDGVTWTAGLISAGVPTVVALNYVNSLWVAAITNTSTIEIWTSSNGTTWTQRYTSAAGGAMSGVAYGNGLYVVCGVDGSGNGNVWTSPDGITWTSRSLLGFNRFYAVVWTGLVWFAVGVSPAVGVATSPDAITWKLRPPLPLTNYTGALNAIARNGVTGVVLVCGGNGVVATSLIVPSI